MHISSITSLCEMAKHLVISGPAINSLKAALDQTNHSDPVPFNKWRKPEFGSSQWLAESLLLVVTHGELWVRLLHQTFLIWGKWADFCGLSVCSPSAASAVWGICSRNFLTAAVSGCKSQCWLGSSSFFYLRALFRKGRALHIGTLCRVRYSIPATQHPFPTRAPLACTKQIQLILGEDLVSPDLMQQQQNMRVLQESTQRVWLQRGERAHELHFECTKRELSMGSKVSSVRNPVPQSCILSLLCSNSPWLGLC